MVAAASAVSCACSTQCCSQGHALWRPSAAQLAVKNRWPGPARGCLRCMRARCSPSCVPPPTTHPNPPAGPRGPGRAGSRPHRLTHRRRVSGKCGAPHAQHGGRQAARQVGVAPARQHVAWCRSLCTDIRHHRYKYSPAGRPTSSLLNPLPLVAQVLTALLLPIPSPCSVFAPGGFFPPGTTVIEKRSIASKIPAWNSANCTQAGPSRFASD